MDGVIPPGGGARDIQLSQSGNATINQDDLAMFYNFVVEYPLYYDHLKYSSSNECIGT